MAVYDDKDCKGCGESFTPKRWTEDFCCTKCRKCFNNLRATRGALLYDAFMQHRYNRKAATAAGVDHTFVCRIGEMFHAEDVANGTTSFRSLKDIKADHACKINARVGRV